MFAYVRKYTYLSVAKINKQNSDMTWQRYKLNLRNSHLLVYISNYGAIRLHIVFCNRLDPQSKV